MERLKLKDTISFYRKKCGLTQEALAARLGVSNQAVSKWESAQCCPDIGLLPLLADIFKISIDELFGREPQPLAVHYDLCTGFPWQDDDTLRVILAQGRKLLQSEENTQACIRLEFPHGGDEETAQQVKLEVFGNIRCEASINGDVISHGTVDCNGNINGSVNAGGKLLCGGSIRGDVSCGGNVECKTIEGSVKCEGEHHVQ